MTQAPHPDGSMTDEVHKLRDWCSLLEVESTAVATAGHWHRAKELWAIRDFLMAIACEKQDAAIRAKCPGAAGE